MNSAIVAARKGTLKQQFVTKEVTSLSFNELTEEQCQIALVRMGSHCFTVLDQERFTFEFKGNVLVRMIDHAVVIENMLN